MSQAQVRRLYRSRTERKIAGVAGGLAEYANADPTLMRVLLALGLLAATGPFAPLVYLLLVLIIPLEPEEGSAPPAI